MQNLCYDLAQVNIAQLAAELDSPQLADFMTALDPVNASLPNLTMLCPRHHRKCEPGRANEWDDDDPDRWQVRLGADGIPEVIPPRGWDPARAPVRHSRFGILRR